MRPASPAFAPGQHAQSRHRRARPARSITPAIDNDGADRRELHRYAHPRRRYFRRRHAEQGGRGARLILTGNNSYAGGTTITGGLINFAAANSFGTGAHHDQRRRPAMGDRQQRRHLRPARRVRRRRRRRSTPTATTSRSPASFPAPAALTKTGAGTLHAVGRQQLSGRHGDQRRHARGRRGDANLGSGGRRSRLRRRHAAIPVGLHHQPRRNAECAAAARSTPTATTQRFPAAIGGTGGAHQAGHRHDDAVGRQHLSRRHGGQRRHAAGRSNECLRAGQRISRSRHGATLNLSSFNQTIGSLAGAGAVTLGRGHAHHRQRQHQHDFSGAISGTGGLTKIGTGTLLLTGDEQLYRRDHRQRRHAVGERLDRQFQPSRSMPAACSAATARSATPPSTAARSRPATSIGTLTVQGNLVLTSASALPRRGLAHGCRPHQASPAPRASPAPCRRCSAGELMRAHLHHPPRPRAAARGTFGSLDHHRPPGRLHREPELHRDRRDPEPHRQLWARAQLGTGGLSTNQQQRRHARSTPFFNNGGTLPPGFRQRSSASPAAISAMR